MRHLGERIVVAICAVASNVQALHQFGVEKRGPLLAASERREPGEGVSVDGLGVMEPAVPTEHLVGRLARQGYGGVLSDGAEQQVKRGVHVACAVWQDAGMQN